MAEAATEKVAINGQMWAILLLLTSISQAYDGCGRAKWRCGDICIGHNSPCHCGNQTIFFRETNWKYDFTTTHYTWCCAKTTCEGLGVAEASGKFKGAFLSGANCSSGSVLNLTEPCPNQYASTQHTATQTNERLGGKATVSCNDPDVQDVEDTVRLRANLRSYIPCWEPNQNIRRCINKLHLEDEEYHCKSRSDEKPFSKLVFDPFSLMIACRDSRNIPGLVCPGYGCLPFSDWCQDKNVDKEGFIKEPKECGLPEQQHFFSNDKIVCSHPRFWRDKTCPEYRCNGAFPGQCGATAREPGNKTSKKTKQ